MRAMPFDRARVRHRLDRLILRRERRSTPLGLGAHAAEGFEKTLTVGGKQVGRRFLEGGRRHHVLREARPKRPRPALHLSYGLMSDCVSGAPNSESKFRDVLQRPLTLL